VWNFLLDRWFLLASLMLPFAHFALHDFYLYLGATPVMRIAERTLGAGYAILAAGFLLRQLDKWRRGTPLNAPKL
jgi:hypothetical protein